MANNASHLKCLWGGVECVNANVQSSTIMGENVNGPWWKIKK